MSGEREEGWGPTLFTVWQYSPVLPGWPYLWLQTSSNSNSPARQSLYSQHTTPTMGADKAGAKKSMGLANAEFKKGNYAEALKHYDKEGWDLRRYEYYIFLLYNECEDSDQLPRP